MKRSRRKKINLHGINIKFARILLSRTNFSKLDSLKHIGVLKRTQPIGKPYLILKRKPFFQIEPLFRGLSVLNFEQ